jgi:hypothetical protein
MTNRQVLVALRNFFTTNTGAGEAENPATTKALDHALLALDVLVGVQGDGEYPVTNFLQRDQREEHKAILGEYL